MVPPGIRRGRLPQGLCVELKYLDSDEFDHWAGLDAFGATARTMRKLREWEVFHALREGRARRDRRRGADRGARRSSTT